MAKKVQTKTKSVKNKVNKEVKKEKTIKVESEPEVKIVKKQTEMVRENVHAHQSGNFFERNKGLLIGVGIALLLLLITVLRGLNTEKVLVEWVEDTSSNNPVVTVIASTTCPNCTNLKPIITELSEEYDFKLYFYESEELTADEVTVLHNTYDINYEGYVPYVFVTKNGKVVKDTTGFMDKDASIDFLKSANVIE